MRPSDTDLQVILEAGLKAPSAENRHYLTFRVKPDAVWLYSTDGATWQDRPHREFLACLSYGAVVENIVLRAAELGHAVEVQWFLPREEEGLVAKLRWSDAVPVESRLARAIAGRHTNRRFYRREKIVPQILAKLASTTGEVEGCRLLWLDAGASRSTTLSLIRLAETERFRRRKLHQELFEAVRFEQGWSESVNEWLPPAALEVEPPLRRIFAALRHWPLMRLLHFIGGHLSLGLRAAYLPAVLSSNLGLVVARRSDAFAVLNGGRAFQRMWLQATVEELAMQPMAAATVLLRQKPGDGWVDEAVQKRIKEHVQRLLDLEEEVPCMFFRIGRAAPPAVIAGRRPVADYLVGEDSGRTGPT